MGITLLTFKFEQGLLKSLNIPYKGLNLCELGNQKLMFERKTGKEYYASLGVNHVSIDLNGKDGALPLNLDIPLPNSFLNKFNVVTDYGTMEHVNNQYQAFKNVHDICKVRGIIIHVLPSINAKEGGRYFYSKEFMKELAKRCKYKIIDLSEYEDPPHEKNLNKVTRAAFLKTKNSIFINQEEFRKIKGVRDSGKMLYTGNYEKKLSAWIVWYLRVLKNPKNIRKKIYQIFSRNQNHPIIPP